MDMNLPEIFFEKSIIPYFIPLAYKCNMPVSSERMLIEREVLLRLRHRERWGEKDADHEEEDDV